MSSAAGEPATDSSVAGSAVPSIAQAKRGRDAPKPVRQRTPGERRWLAWVFLGPALIMLAAIVVYPLIYTAVRSLFGDGAAGSTGSFVGLQNFGSVFSDSSTLRAVKNNVIWVVVTPTIVTILGLVFAVLSERIRWATVFKTILFMPIAISFLASGVTFGLIYSDQPSQGLANAVTVGIHDIFSPSTGYPNVHPKNAADFDGSSTTGFTSKKTYTPGSPSLVPLAGIDLKSPPASAGPAAAPAQSKGLYGVVWNDFKLGGGGKAGVVDPGELGLAGITVEALQNGKTVASTTADAHGGFSFPALTTGSFQLRLPAVDFTEAFAGYSWLGPDLITPAIIISYLWVYAGFAMVLLAAGMASLPRDVLEAARIDGATEWQLFRRVTVPLLAPVLLVVFVTMVINVLKVFDLVFVIQQSAGANGKYADVLAVSLYNAFGNQQYGIASAIGIILVLLVIPAMALNIRRFRRDQQ